LCFSTYEQYREQFEKKCSFNILTLFYYYGSSSDLFDFVDSLTADDVYNLQEAVNDWDETLVNTKTIFYFATVKNFLDRAYAAISDKQAQLSNQQQQAATDDEQKEQNITFADLSELRDRARLLEYSSNVQKADHNERDIDKL
ncbi:unnamed protein product, partial [Rotaria magnacalcarata]